MPDFLPFRGIRYGPDEIGGTDLSAVAAPPYDVVDERRRAHLRERSPFNAIHLTLPAEDGGRDRYEHAGDLWREWLDSGVLVADDTPRFYVYEVQFQSDDGSPRRTTGVIGALELCTPGEHGILPHERTMPKPKGDRLDLLRSTRANLEPIWGLSLAPGLTDALVPEHDEPLGHVTDTRGAHHRLFALTDPERVDALRSLVANSPVVLADGHHRYETSIAHRDERRAAEGDAPGAHDHILCLVVELSADQLAVQPIHRLVTGLGERSLRPELARWFDLIDLDASEGPERIKRRMAAEAAPALVDREGVALLLPRSGELDEAMRAETEPMRAVDAARFEAVIAPLLASVGAEVEYRHDLADVSRAVGRAEADAAVLLRPVEVPTIQAVARAGDRMPQKTTFFHPKPSTGLVFRSLDLG